MTLLLITAIACMYWIYDSRQVKINHLQLEVNILFNYKLNEPFLRKQIKTLKADKALLQQDVAYYKGKWASDELYIDVLESRYLQVVTYANVAEAILFNNGINFTRIKQ